MGFLPKTVVVVCGNMGHGKGAMAAAIAKALAASGYPASRIALANPLKEAAHVLLGIPRSVVFGSFEDKNTYTVYGRTARQWLRWLGTDIGRDQVHPGLWVDRTCQEIAARVAPFHIIDDGRFANERAVAMNVNPAFSGQSVRVYDVLVRRPSVAVDLSHQSEADVAAMDPAGFDFSYVNVGSLEDMDAYAARVVVPKLISDHRARGGVY